jgi:hypothetical protein
MRDLRILKDGFLEIIGAEFLFVTNINLITVYLQY